MLNSFRMRLTIIFIIFVGLIVVVSGIFMVKILEKSQMELIKEHRTRELGLILTTLNRDRHNGVEQNKAYFTLLAAEYGERTDARITFIFADGAVMGDSDLNADDMGNHLNREEIIAAGHDGFGYATRYSDSLKQNMLYVAIPIEEAGVTLGYVRVSISLAEVDSYIKRMWAIIFVGMGMLFVVTGFIGYRVASRFTQPLEKITKVAKQMSDLDGNERVAIRNRDEIGELGHAINTMADSLQKQMGRIVDNENRIRSVLSHMTNGVLMIDSFGHVMMINPAAEQFLGYPTSEWIGKKYRDTKLEPLIQDMVTASIETRVEQHGEIKLEASGGRIVEVHVAPMFLLDQAWIGIVVYMYDITSFRHLEKVRSEFIANVSHELKTPITSVKGFAETLLSGAMNNPETLQSFLQIIFDESDRLHRLIHDILELSQIESRQVDVQSSPVHLNSFIQDTVNTLKNHAEQKSITLHVNVDDKLYIEADEDLLRQVLINLVSNGITYTGNHGRVEVSAHQVGQTNDYERVQIVVTDSGRGIPQKDLPRIFERFYRVDKGRSRLFGGTGLGLSIVKHLVELHQGTIKVESTQGIGTTFTIELPVIQ